MKNVIGKMILARGRKEAAPWPCAGLLHFRARGEKDEARRSGQSYARAPDSRNRSHRAPPPNSIPVGGGRLQFSPRLVSTRRRDRKARSASFVATRPSRAAPLLVASRRRSKSALEEWSRY
jgi:hypothetical protein